MSEVIDVESTDAVDENATVGKVTIEVTDNNVKYDTNFSVPELIFWMKVVEEMVIDKLMSGE